MNESLKKLTEEVKNAMQGFLQTDEIKSFIAKTKEATDAGSFEVVISTEDTDRQGESVQLEGWDFSNYMANPVVLWAHDYKSLPIGVADEVVKKDGNIVAKGRFAPAEANPFAQQVRKLYDAKIQRATSVGFIAREMDGSNITKAELPANPFALSLRKAQELGLDEEMLKIKGIEIRAAAEGDACTLEDGTEGVLKPNADGELVCMPKPQERQESVDQPKDKGAVSDIVNTHDPWDQKFQKLDKVFKIIDAFIDVYLREETPVADFDPLLKETLALMNGLVETQEKAKLEGEIKKILESNTAKKYLLRKKDVEAIGAELSAMQSTCDDAMVTHAKRIIEIAQSYEQEPEKAVAPAEDPTLKDTNAAVPPQGKEGGVGEEDPKGSPKEKVDPAGLESALKGLNEYLEARAILRTVSTTISLSLERLNKKLREGKH